MGKGTILSGEDGRYTVNYNYATAVAKIELAQLDFKIAEHPAVLAALIGLRDPQRVVVENLSNELNGLITTFAICAKMVPKCPTHDAQLAVIVKKLAEQIEAKTKYYVLQEAVEKSRADNLSNIYRRGFLISLAPPDKTIEIWSADNIDSDPSDPDSVVIGKEVATLEVMGNQGSKFSGGPAGGLDMPNIHIIVRPLYDPEGRKFVPGVDKGATPIVSMGVWQSASVVAQFPYAVAHNPRYLTGIISNIDYENHTCNVQCDGETPSDQAPTGFKTINLTKVPIYYMNCDASAFKNSDYVIVEFGATQRRYPRVIGFVRNPRKCSLITMNGAYSHTFRTTNSETCISFSAWMRDKVVSQDMRDNPGRYTIYLNGAHMPEFDRDFPRVFYGPTDFKTHVQLVRTSFDDGRKSGFYVYSLNGESSLQLQVFKGSQTLVNCTVTSVGGPVGIRTSEPLVDSRNALKVNPRWGQSASIYGFGVEKQTYQSYFSLTKTGGA